MQFTKFIVMERKTGKYYRWHEYADDGWGKYEPNVIIKENDSTDLARVTMFDSILEVDNAIENCQFLPTGSNSYRNDYCTGDDLFIKPVTITL